MTSRRPYRTCLAGMLALATLTAADRLGTAAAASSPLSRAIANTDTALSYREDDTNRTVVAGASLSQSSWEIYDQRHNRERDHAHFDVVRANGKRQSYTVDIVMMNNHTYYRSTLNHGGWKVQSGYGYADPVSGQRWFRAAPSFSYLAKLAIASQGSAPGGRYRVHFQPQFSAAMKATGSVDVWLSTGSTPYIVREKESVAGSVKGKKISEALVTRLSRFNQPVTITAPKLGS